MSGHRDTSAGGSIGTRLDEAIAQIARTRTLLVALDFDGTLSETVDDPDTARALPGANTAIRELVTLADTRVAVVSGRALASLERVAELPEDVLLVGSHGSEFRFDGTATGPETDENARELLGRLSQALTDVAAGYPGARIEIKPSGCGLHTRLSSPEDATAAQAEALLVVEALDGSAEISCRYGKDIQEFTIHAADKGSALITLREYAGASAVLFIGDDVTDEDGFRVLTDGDVGIKVGAGNTDAEYRIEDPEAVSRLLGQLAAARAHAVAARVL